jgi:hypothetical protein
MLAHTSVSIVTGGRTRKVVDEVLCSLQRSVSRAWLFMKTTMSDEVPAIYTRNKH